MIKKANGYIRINDILQDEINFWASYGVYLVREELKTELYNVIFDYKDVLVKVYRSYSSFDITFDEDELDQFGLSGMGDKNAASRLRSTGKKQRNSKSRRSRTSRQSKDSNGSNEPPTIQPSSGLKKMQGGFVFFCLRCVRSPLFLLLLLFYI